MERVLRLLEELEDPYSDKSSFIELADDIRREVRRVEKEIKEIRDALLERSRFYALRSKAAERAAKRSKHPAEREIMEEKARIFLKVSREYFATAMSFGKVSNF